MNRRNLRYSIAWEYDFQHPIERVWEYVSNTDRMNRAAGVPVVAYRHEPIAGGGSRRFGEAKNLGMTLRWLEHPYEWVRYEYFRNERDYLSGPLAKLDIHWAFSPTATGCRVTQSMHFEAKNWLLDRVAVFQIGGAVKRGFMRAYRQLDEALVNHTVPAFVPAFPADRPLDEAGCARLVAKLALAGVDGELQKVLLDVISKSQAADLVRIRPFALAKQLDVDRLRLLTALLKATKAGVCSLSWDLLCPSCRGAKQRVSSLTEIVSSTHCDACDVNYTVEFDQSVELSFTVNPTVRDIPAQSYCVGGPQNTPHVLAQLRLPAANASVALVVPSGMYRVRSLASSRSWSVDSGGDASAPASVTQVQFADGAGQTVTRVETSSGRLELVNTMDREITAMIERTAWLEDACTAAYVTSLQDFRDVFSSEVLRPGQEIQVTALALLFTDIKGSTSMYRRVGDAAAFSVVQHHFEILIDTVRGYEGALVKTIGDAVMASFTRPDNAVKAAIEIQRRIDESNRAHQPEGRHQEQLQIKIGIHYGPCYAVTSNERLDYFGTTVNIASRTEGQCEGGDVVISQNVLQQPGVEDVVQKSGHRISPFIATLKGFEEKFELFRIECVKP